METRVQYLAFTVGGDEYAVPILDVREIVRFEAATRVPATPAWIRGVANLRGQVLPVVDLAAKFGFTPCEATSRSCIVVFDLALDGETCGVGALVESVNQVLELAPGEIAPPPAFGTQIRVEYLVGAAAAGSRFVLLLDAGRVLSAEDRVSVATLLETSQAEGAAPTNEVGAGA